jgi:hypothetical protein
MLADPEPLAPGVRVWPAPPFASVPLDEQPIIAIARLAVKTLTSFIVAM